jgi:uncharacterized membrane protein
MDFPRLYRHLTQFDSALRRAFPADALHAIEAAIKASERRHVGEIRFVVEAALDLGPLLRGQSPRERAIEVFSQLRVWDTEQNNGVLLYLLLADSDVEIVADRGISARLPRSEWETICRDMEAAFRLSQFEAGVLKGVEAIGELLARTFPAGEDGMNELSDRPLLL